MEDSDILARVNMNSMELKRCLKFLVYKEVENLLDVGMNFVTLQYFLEAIHVM